MRTVAYILAGVIALVLENLLGARWPIWGRAPQFTLLYVMFLGMSKTPIRHIVLAFAIGYTQDLLTATTPGFSALSMTAVFCVMTVASRSIYMRGPISLGLLTLALSFFVGLSHWALIGFFGLAPHLGSEVMSVVPRQALLNLGGAVVAFPLLFRVEDATDEQQRDGGYLHDYW